MDDIKISLTITLPGRIMMSEQECSKQLFKKVYNSNDKPVIGKNGKPLYKRVTVPDFDKNDVHTVQFKGTQTEPAETYKFFTRKNKLVKQVINMSKAAYDYFIENTAPYDYPKSARKSWGKLSKKEKIEWHLNSTAEAFGGKLLSYKIFDD